MQRAFYIIVFLLLIGYQNCAPSKDASGPSEFTNADVTVVDLGEDNMFGGGTDTGSDQARDSVPLFSAIAGAMYQKYTECSGAPYVYEGWEQLQNDINLFNRLKLGPDYTSFSDVYIDAIDLRLVGDESSFEQCLAYMSSTCRIYEETASSFQVSANTRSYVSLDDILKVVPSDHGCSSVYTRFSSE